ncbi:ATP-binding protein [Acinetobacter baumannii]|nr:ATP-binding protein [Acinetobacter baumannii]
MGTYSNITIENDQFYSLEKHFEIACNRHPHLKLLESQWRFDQELISKALQNINTIFPHYSRHDASHSKQIIVNIERMLGDKIKYLSATDTWLILEAAYNHDIGMVITQKQIEDMNTPEFQEFVRNISQESESELCKFAKDWIDQKAILPPNAEAHSIVHQYTQLLAEWYRKKHPQNSASIVRNPLHEIGLDSPRNELLPKRLFKVLSNICKAHGDDFEKVKQLPKAEAGLASEDCHPLYVACLIRMGDLLDVDDNRFCPVMMQMCGSNLPKTSLAHYHKHQSISHFRLDSEQIEIICECPTPESYEAAFDWFSWLNKEYNNQTQYWNNIVPCKELGRLPTLIEPIVKIEEPFEILEIGRKPEFKIDQKALIELVTGANLYNSKLDALREILQNSIDATILRAWIDNKNKINFEEEVPNSKNVIEIYKQYPIEFLVENIDHTNGMVEVEIKDNGIGINLDTLKYIFEVGASHKNKNKKDYIQQMPKWFKPSGAFGLGFQSIFLITRELKLESQELNSSYSLSVNIKREGINNSIVIKKMKKNDKFGTSLKFKIDLNDISGFRFPSRSRNKDFDPILDIINEKEILASDLKRYCNEVLLNSPLNIKEKTTNQFFIKEKNILVRNIDLKPAQEENSHSDGIIISFRGQPVRDGHIYLSGSHLFKIHVDLYGYDAKEILNFSRNSLTFEAREEVGKDIKEILLNYISNKWSGFNNQERKNASKIMLLQHNICEEKYIENFLDQLHISSGKKNNIIVDEILKDGYFLYFSDFYVVYDYLNKGKYGSKFNKDSKVNFINYRRSEIDDFLVLRKILNKRGYFIKVENVVVNNIDSSDVVLSFHKKMDFPFSKVLFKNIVEKYAFATNRIFLNDFGVFPELCVNRLPDRIAHIFTFNFIDEENEKYILLPIKINEKGFEYDESLELIEWIYVNRYNQSFTKKIISQKVQEFVIYLKNYFKN